MPVATEETSFRDKIRTIGVVGLSSSPRTKSRVDDHGTHEVVVTEHATKDERVDVTVRPPTTKKSRS